MQRAVSRREAIRRVGLMLGGAVSAPAVAGVLGGCRARSDWTPSILTGNLDELVTSIAEQIIPETDTPGAKSAGVNRFIDRMLAEWYPEEFKQTFLEGLSEVDSRARTTAGDRFIDLSEDRRRSVLEAMDVEAFPAASREAREQSTGPGDNSIDESVDAYGAADSTAVPAARPLSADVSTRLQKAIEGARERVERHRPDGGPVVRADEDNEGVILGDPPPFIRMMKELTLLGYYTSEIGATQELKFVPVPGRWQGCIPFEEVERAWAV